MIPFKSSYKLSRECLRRPVLLSFINAILDELEWKIIKKNWKRRQRIWEKLREHGRGVKGKVVTVNICNVLKGS